MSHLKSPSDESKGSGSRFIDNIKENLSKLSTMGDSLHHDLRTRAYQYNPLQLEVTKNIQMVIKSEKNTKATYDNLGKERFEASKRLFIWGRDQDADLQDVSDHLALLIHRMGEIELNLSTKFEIYRNTLKEIRNFESDLHPQRDKLKKLQKEILDVKRINPQNHRIAELEAQQEVLERNTTDSEAELANLKRRALKEAYDTQFDALIESSEKMAILASYGKLLVNELDTKSYSVGQTRNPYESGNKIKQIMAEAKTAIADWTPQTVTRPLSGEISVESYSDSAAGKKALDELNGKQSSPLPHGHNQGQNQGHNQGHTQGHTQGNTQGQNQGPTQGNNQGLGKSAPPPMPPRPVSPMPTGGPSSSTDTPSDKKSVPDVNVSDKHSSSTMTSSSLSPGRKESDIKQSSNSNSLGLNDLLRSDSTASTSYRDEPTPAYSESVDTPSSNVNESTPAPPQDELPSYSGPSEYPSEKNH